jgi:PAS domain S-box-containing protein
MTIADIRPKEDLQELLNHVYSVTNTFTNPRRYWRHIKKDGQLLYVNISGHGINFNGCDAEMVMAHDITLEVESREKITLAKENLDALINSIREDIWSIDSKYRLISVNNSYKKAIEASIGREIVIGESIFMPEFDNEDNKQRKKYYDKALKGETFTFIELINHPGEKPFCAETKLNPIRNKNKIIGVACISTNIQERLEAHDIILEQNKTLREVISIASHEIRGPVATLLGLIAAFNKENPTDPFNQEVMSLITDVTTNLDTVIHELVNKSYALKEERKSTPSPRHNQSVNE